MKCPVCGADLTDLWRVGNFVRINNSLNHDKIYGGQFGVITKITDNNYYYITVYNKRSGRYWLCGFEHDEFVVLEENIEEFYNAYQHWREG
ncbi:conserved protein of unknown function [Ruminococcaceae bacterium BL-6]|nr:conserved protein of unknown function [Ruminococcaceae bacterium BL-6]